jgi:geranylgeranyl diphosphate synthase type I
VEARLRRLLDEVAASFGSDPIGPQLPQLLAAAVLDGGKRLRPALAHWGWAAVTGDHDGRLGRYSTVVEVGAALELFHAFALVHDDVMDGSATRRGSASVWARVAELHSAAGWRGDPVRYGQSVAILVGDLALAEVGAVIADLGPALRSEWQRMVRELVRGQHRDLHDAAVGSRDLAAAREVAQVKSGAYTVTRPLRLGALAGGAGAAQLAALSWYGSKIGEAFALRDDVLGIWGSPRTGKPVGDDLIAGKATVLLALAERSLARITSNHPLLARVGDGGLGRDEIELLTAELAQHGVRDDVEDLITGLVDSGVSALDDAGLNPTAVEALRSLASRLAWRSD